ncbi:hypothetical protein [Methylobacterium sp. CCH5-D2]|uniref:hypothetical protein n=1 Tax=Methylobacterium sp. CCH5-D2 TaxID=1768765 RepID=UPI000A6400F3|nr:hypothetical protein [Methylobacterium sp. CCH5-D2]
MSQRVTEQTYWIVANGADTEEVAQIIQSALISLGDCGTITVREKGSGKVVIGSVNSLVLPDGKAEMKFMMCSTPTGMATGPQTRANNALSYCPVTPSLLFTDCEQRAACEL